MPLEDQLNQSYARTCTLFNYDEYL